METKIFKPEQLFQLYYLPNDYREENDLIEQNNERFLELKETLLKECNGDLDNGYFNPKERIMSQLLID